MIHSSQRSAARSVSTGSGEAGTVPPQGGAAPSIEIALPSYAVQPNNPLLDPITLLVPASEQLLHHAEVADVLADWVKAKYGFIPGRQAQRLAFRGPPDAASMLMRALVRAGEPGAAAASALHAHLGHLPEFRQALCMILSQELQRMLDAGEQPPGSFAWAWEVCVADALTREDYPAVVRFAQACSPEALGPILQLAGQIDPAQRLALMRAGLPLDRCVDAWISRRDQLKGASGEVKARLLSELAAQLRVLTQFGELGGPRSALYERRVELLYMLTADCTEAGPAVGARILAEVSAILGRLCIADNIDHAAFDLAALERAFLVQLGDRAFLQAAETLRAIHATRRCPAQRLQMMFYSLWSEMAEDAGSLSDQPIDAARHLLLAEVLLKFGGAADAEHAAGQLIKLFKACADEGSPNAAHAPAVQSLLDRAIDRTLGHGDFHFARWCCQELLALGQLDWAVDLHRSILRRRGCTTEIACALLGDLRDAFISRLEASEQLDERSAQALPLTNLLCEFGGPHDLRMMANLLKNLLEACATEGPGVESTAASIEQQLLSVATSMLEVGDVESGLDLWMKYAGEGKLPELALPRQRRRLVTFVRTLVALIHFPKADLKELQSKIDSAWGLLLECDVSWSFHDCHFIVGNLRETLLAAVQRDADPSDEGMVDLNIDFCSSSKFANWSKEDGMSERDFAALVEWFEPLCNLEPPELIELVFDDYAQTARFQTLARAAWAVARIRARLDDGILDAAAAHDELLELDRPLLAVLLTHSDLLRRTLVELLNRCVRVAPGQLNARPIRILPLLVAAFDEGGPIDPQGLAAMEAIVGALAVKLRDASETERYVLLQALLFSIPRAWMNSLGVRFNDWLTPAILSTLEVDAMQAGAAERFRLINFLRLHGLGKRETIFRNPVQVLAAESMIRLFRALPPGQRNMEEQAYELLLKPFRLSGLARLAYENDQREASKGMSWWLPITLLQGGLVALAVTGYNWYASAPILNMEQLSAQVQHVIAESRSHAGLGAPSEYAGTYVLGEVTTSLMRAHSVATEDVEDILRMIRYSLSLYGELLSGIPSNVWSAVDVEDPGTLWAAAEPLAGRINEMTPFGPHTVPGDTWASQLTVLLSVSVCIVILMRALYDRFRPQ